MSLVVAHVTPLGVRLAADMRITYSLRSSSFLNAALKLVLLSPTLCVGYAGDVEVALEAIRALHSQQMRAEEAVEHLLAAHVASNLAADFLVASLRPSRLDCVKHGFRVNSQSGWIGDDVAFASYEQHYNNDQRPLPLAEFYGSAAQAEDMAVGGRMYGAINAVVHGAPYQLVDGVRQLVRPGGGVHPSVGETYVVAHPRAEDGLFKYGELNHMQSSPFDEPLPPGLGVVPPTWGSAARGAFSYFILTPREPGVAAIGIYFLEGRLGVLYAPLEMDEPKKYPNVPPRRFVDLVELRYRISLGGLIDLDAFG